MENLNAEVVKKALECCTKGGCALCPNFKKVPCQIPLMRDALALINSQDQRIKELAEENERLRATRYQITAEGKLEMIPTAELVQADTVRKMQERLTKEFDRMHKSNFLTVEVRQWIIDQIAKEMLEE